MILPKVDSDSTSTIAGLTIEKRKPGRVVNRTDARPAESRALIGIVEPTPKPTVGVVLFSSLLILSLPSCMVALDTFTTKPTAAVAQGTSVDWLVVSDVEGIAVEGTAVDGTAVEGTAVDVPAVEGTAVEGTAVEGTAVEGTGVDGTAVESTAVEGTRIKDNIRPKF